MGHEIPLDRLPTDLTADDAVEAAYGTDLDEVRDKLTQGLSVLIECDKQLTLYLYKALRGRLRAATGERSRRLTLLSGQSTGGEELRGTLMQRILTQLQDAVFGGDADEILVLPHLDILTTTTRSGLSVETREAAALLYENPDAVFLAFKDPSFDIPKVIENIFPVHLPLIGIARDRLPHLITQREARKISSGALNPYVLYKYLSGVNAVRCRQILSHFQDRLDYDPAIPESAAQILAEIRQMTVTADVELPRVDLEADIGGYKGVKEKLRSEILDLLLAKEKSTDEGLIRHVEEIVPKGMIFHGPPGTGKTYFAKAMATALDASIIIVPGPEMKSRWVGESEANLRRAFAQARRAAPSIIVFDELDSFAAARGAYNSSSGVEHSMVNQLLTEMDGFRSEELVFVVGTTNFLESLDPALLRPGRFELSIEIPYPNEDDRRAIVDIYLKKFGLEMNDEIRGHLVDRTAAFVDADKGIRFSGDHLNAVARALKREELRRGGETLAITREDVDKAIGTRKNDSVKLQAEEERTIAVHEAGHAVLAFVLRHCPTIEKVTIATGDDDVLGYVMTAVKKNRYVTTELELLDDICVLLGGRTAEKLCLTSISMGAHEDLQRASELARMLVEEMGFGDGVGLRSLAQRDLVRPRPISERTAAAIDDEIRHILDQQQQRAEEELRRYDSELKKLYEELIEKKTLGIDEIREIFGGRDFKSG